VYALQIWRIVAEAEVQYFGNLMQRAKSLEKNRWEIYPNIQGSF